MSFFIVSRKRRVKSPHISRIFTATPILLGSACLLITGILVFSPWKRTVGRNTVLGADTRKEAAETSYEALKIQVGNHPDWPSAYLNLAILAYQLGKFSEARVYLERTLYLDPNNAKAKELKKTMEAEVQRALKF